MASVASSSLAPTKQRAPPSFTLFNELPPEIRIKVWQAAMPDARTVVVSSSQTPKKENSPSLEDILVQGHEENQTWISKTRVPALLHVSAEARHEALKHYQLSLGVGQQQPRIYVDFTKDTLFLGNAELTPASSSLWSATKDMEKIERLAVVPEGAWRVLRQKTVDFNKLHRLIFVHDTEKLTLGPTSVLVEDEAQDKNEELVGRIEQAQRLTPIVGQSEDIMKERMHEAREELETLMMVLPTKWEKEPAIATAIFV